MIFWYDNHSYLYEKEAEQFEQWWVEVTTILTENENEPGTDEEKAKRIEKIAVKEILKVIRVANEEEKKIFLMDIESLIGAIDNQLEDEDCTPKFHEISAFKFEDLRKFCTVMIHKGQSWMKEPETRNYHYILFEFFKEASKKFNKEFKMKESEKKYTKHLMKAITQSLYHVDEEKIKKIRKMEKIEEARNCAKAIALENQIERLKKDFKENVEASREADEEIPEIDEEDVVLFKINPVECEGKTLVNLVKKIGLAESKGIARKLITQGAIYIDDIRVTSPDISLSELFKIDENSFTKIRIRRGKYDAVDVMMIKENNETPDLDK